MPSVANPLVQRGLRPVAELAEGRSHGDRLRYLAGCRCADCRSANTEYERARSAARKAGDWNGLVSAAPVRLHLAKLACCGVGRRAVSEASGVAELIVEAIGRGRKGQVRARTARAILGVTATAASDHALVAAPPSWRLLRQLLGWGYTQTELSRELGYQRGQLQFSRERITARNAHEIERLHERLRCCYANPTLELLGDLVQEGYRRERVVRLLEALAERIAAPAPDLKVRNGFIRASTAELVKMLHEDLTGEAPVQRGLWRPAPSAPTSMQSGANRS